MPVASVTLPDRGWDCGGAVTFWDDALGESLYPYRVYRGSYGALDQSNRSSLPGMDAESRDLLTVEQAANYLQLSQSSIRSYIRQGKLKAFRIAGKRKVLIPRDELLKLLEPAREWITEVITEDEDDDGPARNSRNSIGGK